MSDDQTTTEATIVIRLTRSEAERLRLGLADISCWARGFVAACPKAYDRHPLGVGEVREVSALLGRALDMEGEMPF